MEKPTGPSENLRNARGRDDSFTESTFALKANCCHRHSLSFFIFSPPFICQKIVESQGGEFAAAPPRTSSDLLFFHHYVSTDGRHHSVDNTFLFATRISQDMRRFVCHMLLCCCNMPFGSFVRAMRLTLRQLPSPPVPFPPYNTTFTLFLLRFLFLPPPFSQTLQ